MASTAHNMHGYEGGKRTGPKDIASAGGEYAQGFNDKGDEAQKRQASQADYGQAQQSRGAQQDAMSLMAQAARGNAPSQAEIAGRQQASQMAAMQRAQAASARGPQALAQAQSAAQANTAAGQAQIAGQTMAQRAAEMDAARGAYASQAGAMRGMDASEQQFQAQLQAQQRAQNDAYSQAMYGQGFQINNAQQQAELDRYKAEMDFDVRSQQASTAQQAQDLSVIQAGASMIGGVMGGLSDERSKKGVRKAKGSDIDALLGALSGAEYTYKDAYKDKPGAGDGDQFGPASAQKIAKTKLGKSIVKRGEDGILRLDGAAGMKAMMSALAHVNAKVDGLSKKKVSR
jgi:hypothetical protein